jgi:DNA-binding NtrC family response regulator
VARKVLLIEDCPQSQQTLYETLCQQGYAVSTISDPGAALASVEEWAKQFHLVILEEAMSGRSGMNLLHEVRSKNPHLPVVVVTRDGDWNGYARALSEGAADYIPLPTKRRELLTAVEGALAQAA